MAELSRDEVIEIVGPISDVIVADIIATGITKAELVTARDRVVRDRAARRRHLPLLLCGPTTARCVHRDLQSLPSKK